MKNYFIVNPMAGKGRSKEPLVDKIRRACDRKNAEYEIYLTRCVGDATEYVRRKCTEEGSDKLRFFACGGDGTLGETVSGAFGFENAAVGVIPVGTGNDFVRNFSSPENFFDIEAQLDGKEMTADLIKCNDRYCINMINIGFDCEVVKKTVQLKKFPLMPSKLAYIAGVLITLIKNPGVTAGITVDGEYIGKRRCQLTTLANGAYCGGGFFSNPGASVRDGKIDSMFISAVTRLKFVSLVGKYKKGQHLCPETKDIIVTGKYRSVDMSFDRPQSISVDGEILSADILHTEILDRAIRFTYPAGSRPSAFDDVSGADEKQPVKV